MKPLDYMIAGAAVVGWIRYVLPFATYKDWFFELPGVASQMRKRLIFALGTTAFLLYRIWG